MDSTVIGHPAITLPQRYWDLILRDIQKKPPRTNHPLDLTTRVRTLRRKYLLRYMHAVYTGKEPDPFLPVIPTLQDLISGSRPVYRRRLLVFADLFISGIPLREVAYRLDMTRRTAYELGRSGAFPQIRFDQCCMDTCEGQVLGQWMDLVKGA